MRKSEKKLKELEDLIRKVDTNVEDKKVKILTLSDKSNVSAVISVGLVDSSP